jgi:hypothetical protein
MAAIPVPDNATASQLQTLFTNKCVRPHDALKYLADHKTYLSRRNLRLRQELNCTSYLAYIANPQDYLRQHVACGDTGMLVVVDNVDGVLLPCCGAPIHAACLASYGAGATCPVEGCGQLIDGHASVTPDVLCRYTETYAAFKLLTAKDKAVELASMVEMIGDQKISEAMPLNALIASGAALEAVVDKARSIGMAERDRKQRTACAVLKQLHETPLTDPVPTAKVSKSPEPAGAAPAASPRKRPRTDFGGGTNDDVPVEPGTELPPPTGGGRYPRMWSDAHGCMKTVMFTRFDGKCPQCSGYLKAGRSVVSPVDGEPDTKPKWTCPRCVFGMTSKEVITSLESGELPAPVKKEPVKPTTSAYGDEADVSALFTL